ncbi:MAG: M48 family metalloprotease [Planctomycetota bacterium]
MRPPFRTALTLAALVLPILACASVMNALEQATDPNSAEGKLVRGANRLRKSFQDLDPSEAHYIGRSVAADILSRPEYPLSSDERLNRYLNDIGLALAATNEDVLRPFGDYRFAALETDEVNAFACPGGTILVTRGLLSKASSEDEVAAILAHEIAHVTLKHGLAAIQNANLAQAFTFLGDGVAQATMKDEDRAKLTELFDGSIDDIVQTLITSGYSREAEAAADALGRKFLAGTGYDPEALRRVLTKMEDVGGDGGMFATHPAPEARIASLGAPVAFGGDAAAYARRTARFRAEARL